MDRTQLIENAAFFGKRAELLPIKDCADSLKESETALKYLRDRGLSDETIKRFRLGVEEARYFTGNNRELPAIIILYGQDDSRFIARSLEEKYFSKPRRGEAGQEPIFNLKFGNVNAARQSEIRKNKELEQSVKIVKSRSSELGI